VCLRKVEGRLLAPLDPNYDAAKPVILQMISRLLAGSLLLALSLLSACGKGTAAAPTNGPVTPLARVVAGTGEPTDDEVARVREVVEREEGALVTLFRGKPRLPYFVHVHADREHMPESLVANLHRDSPGFAILGAHQIHIVSGEMRRTGASLRGVVVHELVHEMLDQFAAPHGRTMPRWFHEGLAQNIAGDTYLGAREDELVWRATTDRLLTFDRLRGGFPQDTEELRIAYAQSYSYVSWLIRTYGMETLLSIAAAADDLTSFEAALVGRTGRSTLDLKLAWQGHLLHGSGATWRVAFDSCFSLLLVAALPVLALALIRRLAADQRAARRLAAAEAEEVAQAAQEPVDEMPDEERSDGGKSW
jgi:hypothetical protein